MHQKIKSNIPLTIAAMLSLGAAFLHLAIILGGPQWYRFFGAGEEMALMAERGSIEPTIITISIASILTIWGLYALSGVGLIRRLPLLKIALCVISGIYLLRGIAGLTLPFFISHPVLAQNSQLFWLVSSLICSCFAIFYILGVCKAWREL